MPFYQVYHTYPLAGHQRQAIATSITNLHCKAFDTPSFFVHVNFIKQEDAPAEDTYFMAGKPHSSNSNRVVAVVRTSPNRTKAHWDKLSADIEDASMCYPTEPREILERTRTKRMRAENGENGRRIVTDDELLMSRHFEAKEMEILAFRHGFSKSVLKDEWVMRQDEDRNEQGDSPVPMFCNEDSDPCDSVGDYDCPHVYVPHAIVNKSYFFGYD
ncbi:putative Cis-3-chloroacrylic acid dehalogenase [Colletotrichum asianum]